MNRPGARITVSIGVAEVRATEPTSRRVYRDADAMLYEAKSQGRATVAARGQGVGLRIVDEPRATRLADRRLLERRVLQSEQETAEIMARMEALLEAAPIGVSFVDRDLRIEMVNHAIGRLTGAPDEGVVGRTIEEVAPERWPQLLPHYRRALDLGVSEQFEERSPRLDGDGSESWRLSTIFPVMDRGEVTGVGRVTLDITDRKRLEEATQRLVSTVAAALATAEETRDPYTSGHQARVSDLASAIAGELGLSESDRRDIALAAAVHDVGKIRVPAEILARPGRLREPEMALVREHARTGHDILMTVEFPEPLCRMVLEHHERIDGSGYPDGLRGDAICLGARIIAVADVFDAMSSSRPYRAAIGDAGALAELRTGAGVRYDETVVRAFLRLREDHPGPGVHPPGGPATVTSPS